MNKMPHSNKSARAQKRAAAKNPAQPQGIPADKVFAQLGEATFANNQLVQENVRLREQIESLEAAIENLNELVEKLTPVPETEPLPDGDIEEPQSKMIPEEEPSLSEDEIEAHEANTKEDEGPTLEELAEEELLAQAKQEAEES